MSAGESGPFWPGTSIIRSQGNAFDWKGAPSIFSRSLSFTATASGRTRSETVSESIARKAKRTGRNPGTITGLSSKAVPNFTKTKRPRFNA